MAQFIRYTLGIATSAGSGRCPRRDRFDATTRFVEWELNRQGAAKIADRARQLRIISARRSGASAQAFRDWKAQFWGAKSRQGGNGLSVFSCSPPLRI